MSELKKTYVYVSSWKEHGGAPGIGLHQFDSETGEISFVKTMNSDLSCNVSCVDEKRGTIYFCNETEKLPELRAGGGGRIFGFKIDPESGNLSEICQAPTFCPNPSYVTLDSSGQYMVVSNHSGHHNVTKVEQDAFGKYHIVVEYDDSVVDLFPINEDGTIGEPLDIVKHKGQGPKRGQTHPHPHTALMSPSGKLFAVCDKGNDYIYMYTIDRKNNRLILCGQPNKCVSGSSPRYCAFHPTLPYFFVNHEGCMDVSVFRYNEEGNLELTGSVRSLPEDWTNTESKLYEQQGFLIHPSGKYIYDLLNGPEMASVFEVDVNTGNLTLIQNQTVDGVWPRGCALSPDGRFLLVGCLQSGDVIVYSIGEDGRLSPTGFKSKQPGASYISFYQA